ncbi:MAG: hypothetical protein COU47_02435 [Candidatus Niyogibacteria bacterium CG10_big_fil_rev_8_21_14_0_10_46_36]|uniref:WD40 repeat domain-containing protein n=1 Tax=Candidatus Niyogibacteria bacterium CG10_big_fil_rev_8_21_14_0_10_46_36 TaxID=1974726 RepID=A0A2H0TDF1_9BACT|nr:MAG: hypothetical protein COU47_02435 [Candidatus Niyogibacteria bacterium CG10_big_fil_rev_8_21_14_0_10_46_36]
MSKPLAIGLIILFIGIIAIGIVLLASQNGPGNVQAPEPNNQGSSFPQSQTQNPPPTSSGILPSERDLIKITNGAISGFTPATAGVRFIEKTTGHVFDSSADGQTQIKISNTTIPQSIDALWSENENYAILRYRENEEIKTVLSQFGNSKTDGVILPTDILSFSYAPERLRVFYTVPGDNDIIGIAASTDNTAQTQVVRLPDTNFVVEWYSPREISFLTPPSAFAAGFLYRYNIDVGSFEKLLGNIPGLDIAWSKNKRRILFSQSNAGTGKSNLFVFNLQTGTVEDLGTEGLAQKCVWEDDIVVYCGIPTTMSRGSYPDDWFSGSVTLNDRIWWINTSSFEKTIVKTLPDIDVAEIRISDAADHLFLTNKKDGTLWSVHLNE